MVLVREVFVGWLLLGQQLLGRQLAVGVGLARYCLGCSESANSTNKRAASICGMTVFISGA